jgi:hypothetical protein
MEEEAEKLMTESFSKNFIDYEEYPQSADIQNRCVSMIGRLFNAPTAKSDDGNSVGTSCIGSSEAIMLGVLAMKRRWKNKRIAEGKSTENPNLIMSSAVQVCWEKATRCKQPSKSFATTPGPSRGHKLPVEVESFWQRSQDYRAPHTRVEFFFFWLSDG